MNNKDAILKNAGILSGITGIICNLLLSGMKFAVGSLSGSVAITADAANNLSDAGSSIVTIIGSAVARKPADREHPFGHGRAESVAALVVAVLILLTGIELAQSSFLRIISPTPVDFHPVYPAVLGISITVKLFMALFNGRLYKKTGIDSLKAVRQDSLNDCLATGAALLSLVVGYLAGFSRLDGIAGIFVSLFILLSGADLLKSFSGALLGQAPSAELVQQVKQILLRDPRILGIHDLNLHEYGSRKKIGSVHVEISADLDLITVHEIIDAIEDEIFTQTDILMTIHMDPVNDKDCELRQFKEITKEIIQSYDPRYRFHDLKLRHEAECNRLIFDLVVPYEEKKKASEITSELRKLFSETPSHIKADITVEHEL